jgi:hypothetical protein
VDPGAARRGCGPSKTLIGQAHPVMVDFPTSPITVGHLWKNGQPEKDTMSSLDGLVSRHTTGHRPLPDRRFSITNFGRQQAACRDKKGSEKTTLADKIGFSREWISDTREPIVILSFLYNAGFSDAGQLAPTSPPRFATGTSQRGYWPAQARVFRTQLAARCHEDGCAVHAHTNLAP